jgi:hypothetical protein
MTGRTQYEERAAGLFETAPTDVAAAPSAHAFLMTALDFAVGPSFEIVIAGEAEAADSRAMLDALQTRFLPNTVVLFRPEEASPAIAELAPYTASQRAIQGRATAYVCQNFSCDAPTTDVDTMLSHLKTSSIERITP